jgi:hypothetical protein
MVPPPKPVFHKLFQASRDKDNESIDDGLEQNRLNQGPCIEAAQDWHQVRQQHCLSHNQCDCRG